MVHLRNESCSRMLLEEPFGSPWIDEDSCGGLLVAEGKVLKKGPWTKAEDAILVEYVKKHGEGSWNVINKKLELSRNGKSCRLRWINHLKPNLKKGDITPEEKKLIMELHTKMGNKWSRISTYLPGRTDNEIKNYWNTRIKRRQRAGTKPGELDHDSYKPNHYGEVHSCHDRTGGEFGSGNKTTKVLSQGNLYDTPGVMLNNYKVDQEASSPSFPDISMNSMLSPGFGSCFSDDPSEMINGTYGLDYSYAPDGSRKILELFRGGISGSHALLNGNFSASKPLHGTEKLELPSLQYSETGLSTVPDEAVDMCIQFPATASVQNKSVSPRNSNLLEALFHEAQKMCSSSYQPSGMSSNSFAVTPSDMVRSSMPNLYLRDWEEYSDPVSPSGSSAASIFSECTPLISLSNELPLSKASSGTDIGPATTGSVSTSNLGSRTISPLLDFAQRDALLGSEWLMQGSEAARDCCILNDVIETLLDKGFCGEYMQLLAGTSSTSDDGFEFDSCPWKNMPAVCHKSELP